LDTHSATGDFLKKKDRLTTEHEENGETAKSKSRKTINLWLQS